MKSVITLFVIFQVEIGTRTDKRNEIRWKKIIVILEKKISKSRFPMFNFELTRKFSITVSW